MEDKKYYIQIGEDRLEINPNDPFQRALYDWGMAKAKAGRPSQNILEDLEDLLDTPVPQNK